MKYFLSLFTFLLLFSCETLPNVYRSGTPVSVSKPDESREFAELMETDKKDKLQRAAEAVNQLINESPNDPKASVLIKNETNCNIIVRISGNNFSYNLPIPKSDKNYIMLNKGTYTFKSNFCEAKYLSTKTLTESVTITLTESYR